MTTDIVARLLDSDGYPRTIGWLDPTMIADAVHEIERLRTEIERLRSELADWQRTVRALEAAAAEQGNIPEMNLEGEEWL